MNADLIGFLLNADDAAEHAELERAVARDPQLAAQVVRLRQSLEPLELLRDTGPVPAGLAKRTVERIMGQPVVRRVAASALPSNDAAPTGSRWLRTRWDAAIACSIVLVMSGLGLQGVSRLHHAYERTACQNNLRSMYNSLETYASANNGAYPSVGRAGDFTVALRGGNGPATVCPAVHVAGGPVSKIDYTYNLGYREGGGRLVSLGHGKHDDESLIPVAADRPLPAWVPRPSRGNHPGGANVLYLNGNVRFVNGPSAGLGGDHIFVNDGQRIAAGFHPADAVLGEADDRP